MILCTTFSIYSEQKLIICGQSLESVDYCTMIIYYANPHNLQMIL